MTQKTVLLRSIAGLIGLILFISLSSSVATAQVDKKVLRGRIMTVLKAYEYKPNPELWKRWGLETVNDILSEIALDVSLKSRLRARAVLALSEIPTERTKITLRSAISRKQTPLAVRRQALYSLAIAFPKTSFGLLKDQLLEGDVHIREAAALALIQVRDPRVDLLLRDRLEREKNLTVRTAMDRSLKVRARLRKKENPSSDSNTDSLIRPDQRDKL